MKTRFFLPVLAFACLLSVANSKCDITMRLSEPFPDIFKAVGDSYIMDVEYTLPAANQTDYYTEYYDVIEKMGRVESHIEGENSKYIYYAESKESWTIAGDFCEMSFTNETAVFFKDDQTEWRDYPDNSEYPTTIGPSGMFKYALKVWKNQKKDAIKMAYMGKSKDLIRGEEAVYWRRCTENGKYWVDYYFAGSNEETPFQDDSTNPVPLRVAFYGVSESQEEATAYQFYDVIKFLPYIPVGKEPFQLPKGLGCKRLESDDFPERFNMTNVNVYFSSEVIYERWSTKDGGKDLMAAYYSTLTFGLDRQIKHLFYFTSQWNNTKPNKDEKDQSPKGKPVEKIIYDTQHSYKYNISLEMGKCDITRPQGYIPEYVLPENRGSIALTDRSVFMLDESKVQESEDEKNEDKKNTLKFLSEGKVRGLDVNIFEVVTTDLKIGDEKTISRVIVTHSYLRLYEEEENTVAVKGAPVQVEVRVYRTDDTLEVLTFNVFGFTTRLPRRYLFNLSPCFENDDDYAYLTVGLEIEPNLLPEVQKKLPQLERAVIESLTEVSELNAVRIPDSMTDMKGDYIYVTLRVLNRPPVKYEFPSNETGKSIMTSDIQGMGTFETCALSCLEEKTVCWGFAVCGATCYYGSTDNKTVESKNGCNLYTKWDSKIPTIPTVENQLKNIVNSIEAGQFKVRLPMDSGTELLTATMAQITDPAEDDSLFDKMGNSLNDRMMVVKAGAKLKPGAGTIVKNLGKLRYDECQSVCLDFKDCETVSYCLDTSECEISTIYARDFETEDMEENQLCNLVGRKYTDHFDTTPGITVKIEGDETLDLDNIEDCAWGCLKFDCLSFDHCSGGAKKGCTLHKVHYVKPSDRKPVEEKGATCRHYSKKLSSDFKKKEGIQYTGTTIPPILNATLEECAKTCIDYGKGTCYGYDFCQAGTLFSTSCTLFDTDPARLTSKFNSACTHYSRTAPEFEARPYSNSYAGGIGFLCFLIGGLLGAGVVFIIAYIRVNRQ